MTAGEAQTALAAVALDLVAIADRLQRIHDELPESLARDAMLEHRTPRDLATEVYGAIEAVLVDEIRPAIEYLEAASRVTVDELRERFDQRRTAKIPEPIPDLDGPVGIGPSRPEPARGNSDAAEDLIVDDSTPLRSSDHDGLVVYGDARPGMGMGTGAAVWQGPAAHPQAVPPPPDSVVVTPRGGPRGCAQRHRLAAAVATDPGSVMCEISFAATGAHDLDRVWPRPPVECLHAASQRQRLDADGDQRYRRMRPLRRPSTFLFVFRTPGRCPLHSHANCPCSRTPSPRASVSRDRPR